MKRKRKMRVSPPLSFSLFFLKISNESTLSAAGVKDIMVGVAYLTERSLQ